MWEFQGNKCKHSLAQWQMSGSKYATEIAKLCVCIFLQMIIKFILTTSMSCESFNLSRTITASVTFTTGLTSLL